MGIFSTIASKIKSAAQTFEHIFVAIFGSQASAQFVAAAEKILASDFGKVILTTVSGLESIAQSQGGAAARATAFNGIKSSAVSAGLDLKDSLINLLIELAVNKMNGTLGAISSATGSK
jgi:hypothetical protein